MSDSMGSNLARGEIFTTSIGSVDLLYTGRIVVCKNCNILSKLKALKRDYLQYWYVVLKKISHLLTFTIRHFHSR